MSLNQTSGQRAGVRTDYHARFALLYARSRALSHLAQQVWADELTRATHNRCVSTVVDIGAGAGRFWPVFLRAWKPDMIVAIDTSAEMLEQSDHHIGVLRVIGDIDALPLAGRSVDVCFCSMVLHYSADPAGVLSGLREVLRPGGVVCIRTGTTVTLSSFDFLHYFPTAKRAELSVMPNQADVEFWLRSAGFEQIELKTITIEPQESRRTRLRKVWDRGFPSLQMVPRVEFARGFAWYAAKLAFDAFRRRGLIREATLFATGRRA
jgi:ubiquinone/menaquinone biosynthesis C-methylase UbiE